MQINVNPNMLNEQVFFSEEEWESYEERAAILEYEAGYSRIEAELEAYHLIVSRRENIRFAG